MSPSTSALQSSALAKNVPSKFEPLLPPPNPGTSSLVPPNTTTGSSSAVSQSLPHSSSQQHPPTKQRPPFSPFFTLISDPSTNSTHHPSQIHYIFSDDDSDVLTHACLRALNPSPKSSPSTSQTHPNNPSASSSSNSALHANPSSSKFKRKTSGTDGQVREERILILDVNETGDAVIKAHSLTPSWQILDTEIGNAPTWEEGPSEEAGEGNESKGLMLKVEGTGMNRGTPDGRDAGVKADKESGRDIDAGDVEFHALMESFDKKMAVLRKVVESGETMKFDDAGEPEANE